MPDTVNPNIPLQAGRNIPSFGPDYNQLLVMQRLAQAQQEQQGYDALRQLYANPQNLGPNGQPTPQALGQLMSVAPRAGMDLTKSLLQDQAMTAQATQLRLKEGDEIFRQKLLVGETALEAYRDAKTQGLPDDAARKAGQDAWSSGRKDLAAAAGPTALATFPTDFDPVRVDRGVRAGNQAMLTPIQRQNMIYKAQDERRKDTQLAQGEERLTIEQQRAAIDQQKADKADANAEKGQWQVLTDPGKRDAAGNPVQYRYNPSKATATTLTGEPYTPSGAAKMGTADSGQPASETEIDYWANVLKNGGALPPGLARTKAGSDMVRQIMAKVPGSGTDPGQFIANHATTRANTTSLSNMTKMADAATSFEKTASENFDLALSLSKGAVPTNWGPWLNRWIENGQTQFGNENVPAYVTAMLTAANEYAKIMSGSTGAQGSTVDSRREAAELFSPYLSAGQIERVVGIAKADMSNRKGSLYGQIQDIRERLGGEAKSAASGASATAPQAAQIPAAAIAKLSEGHETTFGNGQVWTLRDGKPVQVR